MNNTQKDPEWSGHDPEYNFPKPGKREAGLLVLLTKSPQKIV